MTGFFRFSSECNRHVVPVIDQPQLVYLLTEIIPAGKMADVRMPLNFALVLDRSGSMAGDKLHTMKEAVKQIIDQLGEEDLISMITFESRTEVLTSALTSRDKAGMKRLVEKIREGGGTNLAPALSAAFQVVSKHAAKTRVNQIILLTDGVATDLEANSFKIADIAGSKGIPIVGLGFGNDWKEEFLIELADRSIQAKPGSRTGLVDYISKPEKASEIFQEIFQSMQIVVQNVSLTFRMVQGLETRRIWQVSPLIRDCGQPTIEERAIQIPMRQLTRSGAAFLIEILLPPRPEGRVRIAHVEIDFSTLKQGDQRQVEDVILNYSRDPEEFQVLNQRVMDVVEKVQAFRLQTQALEDAQMGDVGKATRKLRQAVTILLTQGEVELANQMKLEADQLEETGTVSSEGKKTIMLTSRKTVRLSE